MKEFNQSDNINRESVRIKRIIRKAGNETIPQSKNNNGKNSPAWFNSSIAKLIKKINMLNGIYSAVQQMPLTLGLQMHL